MAVRMPCCALLALLLTSLTLVTCEDNAMFGDVFAWGASTSAFRTEGAWNVDGKSESIWDHFAFSRGGDTGENTCDGFYRYKEDIGYLKDTAVTHYKFSVAWTRIFPDGTKSSRNQKGIDHYVNVTKELVNRGIKPVVTLYDNDLPQKLEEAEGWLSSAIVDHFEDYAREVFKAQGPYVQTWITIQEPYTAAYGGYGDSTFAPGKIDLQYIAAHNLIKAHTRVYKMYQTEFKPTQTGLVGIVLNSDWMEPRSESTKDKAATQRSLEFMLGWFAEPLFGTGQYPDNMTSAVTDRTILQVFTTDEVNANKGACDFFGIALEDTVAVRRDSDRARRIRLHEGYGSCACDFFGIALEDTVDVSDGAATGPNVSDYMKDVGALKTKANRPVGYGIERLLGYVKTRYNNPVIHVFDKGYGDCGTLYDEARIQYMKKFINGVKKAIQMQTARIAGYFVEHFMDQYEWSTGFKTRYGLYHIEFDRKDRMPKASASFYKTLILHNGRDFDYPAHFVPQVIREKDDFLYESFPPGFAWGVATAAYQIEGGWNADGKGPSIWDVFAHDNRLANGDTGDVACDSYHNYKTDVQMVKALQVSHYRFSIAWSRVLPDGTASSLNAKGVAYYNNLIDELLANGIKPMVTLYHWDLPQGLQEIGGWENRSIADYFNDYARICFEQFGDRVPMWITFNEAFVTSWLGYGTGTFAPGISRPGTVPYTVAHNIIRSHAKAWHTYNDRFRHLYHGQVGITLDCDWKEPITTRALDRYAADRALNFKLGWFAEPLFGHGDYPTVMRQVVDRRSREEGRNSSRLPRFTEEEKRLNKGAADFLGLNHYTTQYVRHNIDQRDNNYEADPDLYTKVDDCWGKSASDWLRVNPWGMRALLRWIRDKYNNPDVYITENGISDPGNSLDDSNRIYFYKAYVNEALKAQRLDNVNLRGYVAWSLMDNLEWTSGYTQKFGIYSVNFTDPGRARTPKKSAQFYSKLVADNGFKYMKDMK